jgi:hypothetical protein
LSGDPGHGAWARAHSYGAHGPLANSNHCWAGTVPGGLAQLALSNCFEDFSNNQADSNLKIMKRIILWFQKFQNSLNPHKIAQNPLYMSNILPRSSDVCKNSIKALNF